MTRALTIGKHTLYAGFSWKSFEEKISRGDLRTISQENQDYVGVYWMKSGERYVWAFATEKGINYRKCVSNKNCGILALEIASRLDRAPFLVILQDKEQYGFLVVDSNKTPLPGSDVWYNSIEEMQEAISPYVDMITEIKDADGAQRVMRLYTGDHSEEKENDGWLSLSQYIENAPILSPIPKLNYVRLTSVSLKPFLYSILVAASLSLVGYAGYMWYLAHQKPIHVIAKDVWHPPVVKKVVNHVENNTNKEQGKVFPVAMIFDDCQKLYSLPSTVNGVPISHASCVVTGSSIQVIGKYTPSTDSERMLLSSITPGKQNGWLVSGMNQGSIFLSDRIVVPTSKLVQETVVSPNSIAQHATSLWKVLSVMPGIQNGSGTIQSSLGLTSLAKFFSYWPDLKIEKIEWNGSSWTVSFGNSGFTKVKKDNNNSGPLANIRSALHPVVEGNKIMGNVNNISMNIPNGSQEGVKP